MALEVVYLSGLSKGEGRVCVEHALGTIYLLV